MSLVIIFGEIVYIFFAQFIFVKYEMNMEINTFAIGAHSGISSERVRIHSAKSLHSSHMSFTDTVKFVINMKSGDGAKPHAYDKFMLDISFKIDKTLEKKSPSNSGNA